MSTQAVMLAEIQADTERTSAADVTAMRNKIAAAVRHYQPSRFYFNESRDTTFDTVSGTAEYTAVLVGATFYTVDAVWLTQSASTIRDLCKVDYRIIEQDRLQSNAIPWAWAFMGGSLFLTNTPDDAYSIRVTGHEKIAEPASDGEADNPWMTEAYDLIMSRAKAELYAHRWEDPTNAALMQAAEMSALASLRKGTTAKVSTGQIVPTSF